MWSKYHIWTWMAVAVLMLSACSGDEVSEAVDKGSEPMAVSFHASVPAFQTRSVVNDISDLQTQGFGVFAYHTGNSDWDTASSTATPNFMWNQQVSGSAWTYSPVKYWPNGTDVANEEDNPSNTATESATQYLSFFAYAPHNGTGLTPSTNSTTGAPTIGYAWVNNVNPTDQADLLYAAPQKNLTRPNVMSKVSFEFHHALTAIEFKVRRKDETGLPIILTSLALNSSSAATATSTAQASFNTSGTFNLGTLAWSTLTSDVGTITYDAANNNINTDLTGTHSDDASKTGVTAYTDETAHALTNYTPNLLLLMPYEGTLTIPFTLSYTLGGTAKTPSSTITFTQPTGGWALAMGKKYTVIFVIDGGEVESYLLRAQEAEQW